MMKFKKIYKDEKGNEKFSCFCGYSPNSSILCNTAKFQVGTDIVCPSCDTLYNIIMKNREKKAKPMN